VHSIGQADAAQEAPRRRPPHLRITGKDDHRHATWLELFFDLVFVAGAAQLANGLVDDHTAQGFLRFAGLFVALAWAWMGFTYYLNRFDTDDVLNRVLVSLGMLAVAGFAVAIGDPQGSAESARLALSYAAIHLVLLALYGRAWRHIPAVRTSLHLYFWMFGAGALLWLASLAVEPPARMWVWAAALALEFAFPLLGWGRLRGLPVDREHLEERFGLFTIIVLGEAVIAVVVGTDVAEWKASSVAGAVVGFLGAVTLWWIYFDFRSFSSVRGGRWPFVESYGHVPLWLAITAYGVGTKLAIKKADALAADPGVRWALAGGAALFLLLIAAFHVASGNREPRTIAAGRVLAGAVLVALAAGAAGLKLVSLVVIVVLVLLVALLLETLSVRDRGRAVLSRLAALTEPPEPVFRLPPRTPAGPV
jgi:low temperature requirement protein LtrA